VLIVNHSRTELTPAPTACAQRAPNTEAHRAGMVQGFSTIG